MGTTRSGTCIVPSIHSSGLAEANGFSTTRSGTCIVSAVHPNRPAEASRFSPSRSGTRLVPSIHSSGLPIYKGPSRFFRVRSFFQKPFRFFSFSLTEKEREHLKILLMKEFNARHSRRGSSANSTNNPNLQSPASSQSIVARAYIKLGKLLNLQNPA